MHLEIEWQEPIKLRSGRREGLIYALDFDEAPRAAGVYVFARTWGSRFESLYVGKSKNVRGRMKSHVNNLRLMNHIKEAKSGKRVLFVGLPVTKPGQQLDRILTVLEKTLIRHFLSEGHDLVNHQGTRVRRHSVTSRGMMRGFVPAEMFLERHGRG